MLEMLEISHKLPKLVQKSSTMTTRFGCVSLPDILFHSVL